MTLPQLPQDLRVMSTVPESVDVVLTFGAAEEFYKMKHPRVSDFYSWIDFTYQIDLLHGSQRTVPRPRAYAFGPLTRMFTCQATADDYESLW